MHIAIYTNAYLPLISGVVRSVCTFRRSLSDLGHNVFVFAQNGGDYKDDEPFIFRYPTLDLPISKEIPLIIPISSCIDQLLPVLKLDVIHTNHPVLLGQTAAAKAGELDLPLVFTFNSQYREYSHYFPISQEKVQDFIRGAIDNWLKEFMVKCNYVVVPTQSMCDLLVDEYGLLNNFRIIPTGIDLRPYQAADGEQIRQQHGWGDDLVMISAGRLSYEKNWYTLLEASSLAMKVEPRLRVVLIGDGPERKDLRQFVEDLGIADRVEFLGEVPFEDMPNYLKAADLFGFASKAETQGLITMEAMAAGLPVVAVNATGTRDVVQSGTEGTLTDNDPKAFGQGIIHMLTNPAHREACREAALKKVATFDTLESAKKLVEVYQLAIEEKKAGRFVRLEDGQRSKEML